MIMVFDANIPIYLQIMEDLKKKIIAGNYKSGEKIASVRELAVSYGVNPNTVQRSLSELEREGLLYSERTSGRFITKDEELLKQLKSAYAIELLDVCIKQLQELQFDKEAILKQMKERLENE